MIGARSPVRWVGRAKTPAEAVPCPTCGAMIEQPCDGAIQPMPHRERGVRAEALGFVADMGDLAEATT